MQQILVTGGSGFVGSEFIRQQLSKPDRVTIVNLDKLTSTSNLDTLAEFTRYPQYVFHRGDITNRDCVQSLLARYSIDAVVNFADENDTDPSLLASAQLVNTNIVGTQVLLDAARNAKVFRYLQVSTDEVYGTLGTKGSLTEESPIAPSTPYSASKAAADVLVRSYHQSYGFPALIARASNVYGPFQSPETLLPRCVTNLMADQSVLIDGIGQNVRDWIHVSDWCRGIDAALHLGRTGSVYLFGGRSEKTNFEITLLLLEMLRKPVSLIRYSADRPGHDKRRAIDCTKAERELGWQARFTLKQGLQDTIDWYREHLHWVSSAKRGAPPDLFHSSAPGTTSDRSLNRVVI